MDANAGAHVASRKCRIGRRPAHGDALVVQPIDRDVTQYQILDRSSVIQLALARH